jgi:hypothetical protein
LESSLADGDEVVTLDLKIFLTLGIALILSVSLAPIYEIWSQAQSPGNRLTGFEAVVGIGIIGSIVGLILMTIYEIWSH